MKKVLVTLSLAIVLTTTACDPNMMRAVRTPPVSTQSPVSSTVGGAACPNIAGSYIRPSDSLILIFEQSGCNINGVTPPGGYDHSIQGQWAGSYFNYTVSRRNLSNGCVTKMYGRLYQDYSSQIRTEIYGTDGRCDLRANFTENSIWNRR